MDEGTRKITVAMALVTGLLAAGQYIPALLAGCLYIGVNALLRMSDKRELDEEE